MAGLGSGQPPMGGTILKAAQQGGPDYEGRPTRITSGGRRYELIIGSLRPVTCLRGCRRPYLGVLRGTLWAWGCPCSAPVGSRAKRCRIGSPAVTCSPPAPHDQESVRSSVQLASRQEAPSASAGYPGRIETVPDWFARGRSKAWWLPLHKTRPDHRCDRPARRPFTALPMKTQDGPISVGRSSGNRSGPAWAVPGTVFRRHAVGLNRKDDAALGGDGPGEDTPDARQAAPTPLAPSSKVSSSPLHQRQMRPSWRQCA